MYELIVTTMYGIFTTVDIIPQPCNNIPTFTSLVCTTATVFTLLFPCAVGNN